MYIVLNSYYSEYREVNCYYQKQIYILILFLFEKHDIISSRGDSDSLMTSFEVIMQTPINYESHYCKTVALSRLLICENKWSV